MCSKPCLSAVTASASGTWAWNTTFHCGKSLWIAEWITNPAVLTSAGPSSTLPSLSTLIRLEAVTSLYSSPNLLMKKLWSEPGTRMLMWFQTRSSYPKCAASRYIAARSTRAAHSSPRETAGIAGAEVVGGDLSVSGRRFAHDGFAPSL